MKKAGFPYIREASRGKYYLNDRLFTLSFSDSNFDRVGCSRTHIVDDGQGHLIAVGSGKFMRRIFQCAGTSIHEIPEVGFDGSIGIS